MLVFSTAANTAWVTRLRIRIARICFAVSSWTGGSVSTSNSRMVCLSSTPMRSSPRAVSRSAWGSRLFLEGTAGPEGELGHPHPLSQLQADADGPDHLEA